MTIRPHALHVVNSLSRKLEAFVPRTPGHVGMYVCGPTVYSDAHIGHGKSYVAFDVIVRYLRHLGYSVKYIQNITDVGHLVDNAEEGEDKIERIAKRDRIHPLEIAEAVTRGYFGDMEGLGIRHASLYPRATQHIPEQIEITQELIRKGHAYDVGGNVYFSVQSWPDYGVLSGRQIDELVEGTRVQVRSDKRDPRDFALWKRADGGHIQRWNSPWGAGYPGWHIECSAMSMKYLGEEFDIHGGGLENQFPHHECELAQSCAATGKTFARYWLHNNMINRDGQKMSKSLGNGINVRDLLKLHDAQTIRAFLIATHYRSPANYTDEAITAAKGGIERMHQTWLETRARTSSAGDAGTDDGKLDTAVAEVDRAFHTAMDDDFNTPVALAALYEFVRRVNTLLTSSATLSKRAWMTTLAAFDALAGDVLGLAPAEAAGGRGAAVDLGNVMQVVIDLRAALRDQKLFAMTDLLRDRLAAVGIELKDTKEGATWKKRS